MKKDSIVKNALILCAITLIAGALLGFTYNATKDAISEQDKIKTNNALQAVMADSEFNSLDLVDGYDYITSVYAANDPNGGLKGYAFQLETTEGYGELIKLMVGFNIDGTISGIDIIKHSETPGLGALASEDKFKSQFSGKAIETLELVKGSGSGDDTIDAISGATITSNAVTGAVNEAIAYYNAELKEGN